MRRNIRRALAYMLALALILSNFVGFNTTVKAAEDSKVSNVSIAPGQVVPAKDALLEVTVEGTNLTQLYYQIQEKVMIDINGNMVPQWDAIGENKEEEIKSPGINGGKISIPVPENKNTKERNLRVVFHTEPNQNYISTDKKAMFSQEGNAGSDSDVDKTELNKEIEKAGKLVAKDYTEESWNKMQTVLTEAKKIEADNGATEAAVKEATAKLKEAIDNLKEAKPTETVNKEELQVKHDEVKRTYNNAKYTANSRKPLGAAVTRARYVLEDDKATQQDVTEALEQLEEVSKLPLKEVQGIGRLTVKLKAEEGTTLKDSIKFTLDNVKYWTQNNLFAYKGSFNWLLTGWEDKGEENDFEIYLPEDSEYIATPAVLKIDLVDEDGSAVINKINGETVTEGLTEIKLEAKSTDACDKITFRAYAKDEKGKPMEGIKFDIKNADLMEPVLVSNENGMIEYQVTKWDVDSKITVSLQDGQGYLAKEKFEFSVIEDPEESTRAIISEINGEKVNGGEKPTFVLTEPVEEGKLSKVSIEKDQVVSAKNGVVKATVEGSNLSTLYYSMQKMKMMDFNGRPVATWEDLGKEESVKSPTVTGGELSIPVPENKSAEERTLRIAIHSKANGTYLTSEWVQFKQEKGDGSASTVDKSELNAAIQKADGLLKEDYTEDSWNKMQSVLSDAREVALDDEATETDVNDATTKLQQAIKELQPASADQMTVRIKVADKEGRPVEGVEFTFKPNNPANKEPKVEPSNEKGETTFSLEGCAGTYTLKATETEKYTFNPENGHSITIGWTDDELEIVGNDGVINFLAKEKGDSEKPEEAATVNVKVVDQAGEPVEGVNFTFINPFVENASVNVTPSNDKGETSFSVEGCIGRYTLKAVETEEYTFEPEKGYEYMIRDGQYSSSVEGPAIFTATKKGEEPTPEVNKDALKAKIEEASKIDGNLYTEDSYKKLTDALTGARKVLEQEDATQDAVDKQVEKLTKAIAELVEKPQDSSTVHVKVVDEKGNPVSGVQFTFVNGDGSHSLDIAPSNANGESVFSIKACHGLYSLKAIANEKYTFNPEIGHSLMILNGVSKITNVSFTAIAKSEPEIPEGDVQITKLTSDVQGDIPKKGATVNLSVEGKGLTADNWSAEAVAYIKGTNMEAAWMSKVKASNVTETGAQLVIPENQKVNALDWKVVAGVLKDGKLEKHQELVLQQAGKKSTERVEIKQAILVDDKTLEVTFAKDIKIADEVASDEAALNKMFTIKGKVTYDSEGKPNGTETYYLQSGDKVTASGTKLTIKFAEAMETNNGRFTFEEGALVLADGSKNLLSIEYTILSKPSVTSAKLEKDVFDYKGGKVVAKLQGVKLSALEEKSIEATVTNPLTRAELDLGLEIITGEEPKITFTVPENKTTTTQSYLLTLKVDGKQIYSGTGLRGDRIIASVLAKDVDAGAQTISSMTISGNNPYETGETDQTKFNAYAVPGDEGSLKTEIRIAGTNLDSKKTEVRAIDENGVIWPISHVPE